MSLILHTGFDEEIDAIKGELSGNDFRATDGSSVSMEDLKSADLFLVGPRAKDPLAIIQAISKKDRFISAVVLPAENNFSAVKQSLLFSPNIGKTTTLLPLNKNVFTELAKAALQTRQRRNFARINTSIRSSPATQPTHVHLEHLGNFLDLAPIAAILLNKARQVVGINVFARQMFDLRPMQQITRLNDVLGVEAVETIRRRLENPSTVRSIEVGSAGKFFDVSFAEVQNERGEDLDILLLTDITERKLEQQRIRNVLDALPQMAWTTNANGEVTYLTEGWFRYTGQTYSAAMNEGWLDVIHPDEKDTFIERWMRHVVSGEPVQHEARYRSASGEYRWHLVRGIPMFNSSGKINYWLGTCTDIHDQKMLQKNLAEMVSDRTQELSEVNELLRRSNNDLKEFAYVASHDLKEPLRKIRLFIDRSFATNDLAVREEYLNKISKASGRMLDLIEGIMSYSQLTSVQTFAEIDLNEIVQMVLSDLEVMLREKDARVVHDKLPVIKGIKAQMGQLFSNLITNSLKYNNTKPLVEISSRVVNAGDIHITSPEQYRKYLELHFRDNGIGFNKKYASEIFVIFKRLHNKDEYSGSGIGLALVKKIVENHHGFIEVESEPGKGTSFFIYLPFIEEGKVAQRA